MTDRHQTVTLDAATKALLTNLTATGVKLVAAIDDLTAAVNGLITEVTAAVTELGTISADLTAALATGNTAALESLAGQLNTATQNLTTAVNAAQAAIPATPATPAA